MLAQKSTVSPGPPAMLFGRSPPVSQRVSPRSSKAPGTDLLASRFVTRNDTVGGFPAESVRSVATKELDPGENPFITRAGRAAESAAAGLVRVRLQDPRQEPDS